MPHRTTTAPACEGSDIDFHSERQTEIAKAKEVCFSCDLRAACLQQALSFPDEDQWGVWGGLTADARRKLRKTDPDRWPVEAQPLAGYLGTRGDRWGERYGDGKSVRYGEYEGMVRPAVDWQQVEADELDDRVVSLMDRYGDRYATETETGYALTDESGIVLHVNEVAA